MLLNGISCFLHDIMKCTLSLTSWSTEAGSLWEDPNDRSLLLGIFQVIFSLWVWQCWEHGTPVIRLWRIVPHLLPLLLALMNQLAMLWGVECFCPHCKESRVASSNSQLGNEALESNSPRRTGSCSQSHKWAWKKPFPSWTFWWEPSPGKPLDYSLVIDHKAKDPAKLGPDSYIPNKWWGDEALCCKP